MRTRQLTLWAAIAATTLVLSACGQSETRDESGEITTGGDTDVFSIAIGDCFNDEGDVGEETEINSLPTVPCSEPHDNEVYAEYTFPEEDFPGDEVVVATASEQCIALWKDFVGIAYESSTLEVYPIYPTQTSWEQADDRLVTCAIYDPAKQVTGSLEGAAY